MGSTRAPMHTHQKEFTISTPPKKMPLNIEQTLFQTWSITKVIFGATNYLYYSSLMMPTKKCPVFFIFFPSTSLSLYFLISPSPTQTNLDRWNCFFLGLLWYTVDLSKSQITVMILYKQRGTERLPGKHTEVAGIQGCWILARSHVSQKSGCLSDFI